MMMTMMIKIEYEEEDEGNKHYNRRANSYKCYKMKLNRTYLQTYLAVCLTFSVK